MNDYSIRQLTHNQWLKEGFERFKTMDVNQWKFICPVCGYIASIKDWIDSGAPIESAAFSCIGRWKDKRRRAFGDQGLGPCDYAGGGLFTLNPVHVTLQDETQVQVFEFAS